MNGHVRLICCLMRVWTVRREAAPDVILCRASAEVPVRHLQHLYILCSPPSSPCLSLTLTSLWLLPLAVLSCLSDQHVCTSYTEAISFYMIKKKDHHILHAHIFNIFGLERRRTTSPVSLGGVVRVFMYKSPWAGQKTVCAVCHGVASHCIPSYFVFSGLRQTGLCSVTPNAEERTHFRPWNASPLWRQ